MKKTNKLFALLLSICMIVLIFPIGVLAQDVPVAANGDLAAAISTAKAGDTIKLSGDVVVSSTITIDKNLTIDLGGHTLTATSAIDTAKFMLTTSAGTTVTIQNGKIKNEYGRGISAYGKLSVKGIESDTLMRGLAIYENGDVTVDKATSFTSSASDGTVFILGSYDVAGFKPVLNFYGTAINKGKNITLSGNGKDLGSPTINLYEGAVVTSTNDVALFLSPYNSTLNIYGGTYTGVTALVVRTGRVNIEGGTFIGNGAYQDLSQTGKTSGTLSDGSAILIVSPSGYSVTKFGSATGKIDLTISDKAVLKSENYRALNEAANADVLNTSAITKLEVKGGTFTSAGNEASVAVSNIAKTDTAVTGGVFTTLPTDYVAPTAEAIKVKSTYSSLYMIGTEATAALQNLKSGDTVEVLSGISELTLPEGVTVENSTGSAITVNEVTLTDGDELVAAHNLVLVPEKVATATTEGNIEHYLCTVCGKLYADSNGTKEYTAEEIIIPKLKGEIPPDTGELFGVTLWLVIYGVAAATMITIAIIAVKKKKHNTKIR